MKKGKINIARGYVQDLRFSAVSDNLGGLCRPRTGSLRSSLDSFCFCHSHLYLKIIKHCLKLYNNVYIHTAALRKCPHHTCFELSNFAVIRQVKFDSDNF